MRVARPPQLRTTEHEAAWASPRAVTGPLGDSWGGLACVLLLLGALGYPVAGRIIDGAHLVTDSLGRATIVEDGHSSTLVGVALFCAAVVAACVGAAARQASRRGTSAFGFWMQLLTVWWVGLSVLIPRKTPLGLADLVIIGGIPLVLGVVNSPPTFTTVRRLNLIRDVFAAAQLIYPFMAPSTARLPCRSDKCGIFGHLDTGFFTQENTGIAAVSLLLPLAAASSTRRLFGSSLLAMLVALASGSRTGIASVIVAAVVAAYIQHLYRGGVREARVPLIIRVAPMLATAISTGLFIFADPSTLTGRGSVYAANLKALAGPAMLYGVPWNTVDVASEGYLTSDHGQASHILAKAGIVGFALWVIALTMLLRKSRYSAPQAVGLAVLVGGAARMMTESTFELEVRHTGFLALLLVIGLLANKGLSSSSATQHFPSRHELTQWGAALTAALIAAIAIPLSLSPTYSARTLLAVTVPTSGSSAGEESFRARRNGAASVEALGANPGLPLAAAKDSYIAASSISDMSVAITRAPEAHYFRVTTTGPDAASARLLNDAVAGELGKRASSVNPTAGSARVVAQPLGASTLETVTPWRAHLAVMLAGSAASFLCVWLLFSRRARRDNSMDGAHHPSRR